MLWQLCILNKMTPATAVRSPNFRETLGGLFSDGEFRSLDGGHPALQPCCRSWGGTLRAGLPGCPAANLRRRNSKRCGMATRGHALPKVYGDALELCNPILIGYGCEDWSRSSVGILLKRVSVSIILGETLVRYPSCAFLE